MDTTAYFSNLTRTRKSFFMLLSPSFFKTTKIKMRRRQHRCSWCHKKSSTANLQWMSFLTPLQLKTWHWYYWRKVSYRETYASSNSAACLSRPVQEDRYLFLSAARAGSDILLYHTHQLNRKKSEDHFGKRGATEASLFHTSLALLCLLLPSFIPSSTQSCIKDIYLVTVTELWKKVL